MDPFVTWAAREGRDLATVLLESARGPGGLALWSGIGILLLVACGIVLTSTGRRRMAPLDPALLARPSRRRLAADGREGGARDARGFVFRAVGDVVDTLSHVTLRAVAWRSEPGRIVVELAGGPEPARGRRPICAWESGFLEEGLSRVVPRGVRVREVACRGAGAACCRFVAERA
ncbi:MAG TPA: V4R domain-containing protein [Candidatus Thermoplasmatota archaeon]|nr:V4R domain-containing protein [Candidatus Thermoplasmatota archaeon]